MNTATNASFERDDKEKQLDFIDELVGLQSPHLASVDFTVLGHRERELYEKFKAGTLTAEEARVHRNIVCADLDHTPREGYTTHHIKFLDFLSNALSDPRQL